MNLSIYRCSNCHKARLVDKVNDKWICFACKQKMNIKRGKVIETLTSINA